MWPLTRLGLPAADGVARSVGNLTGDRQGDRRRCLNRGKKKRPPKRFLALPDLEQSKAAVLNGLTSKSGQRSYELSRIEAVRSNDNQISAWLQCVASRLKPPIPVSSAQNWPPEFDE
jgi:hypothetical protein